MFDSSTRPRSEPEQAPPLPCRARATTHHALLDYADRQALEVLIDGRWRYCPVGARADYPDGKIAYHVTIRTPRTGGSTHRAYWWPEDGLRAARRQVR
ncbi:hypothetical protein ACFXI8_27020 [Streptomyces niveus]|uniref:hypothetical protein n=1 Tax=Streptomyces niveus TaxID=193462 RepID=UPI00367DD8D9